MGMFDSIYTAAGDEWQTKAYECLLDVYEVGDKMPERDDGVVDYQVEIFGGPRKSHADARDSLATVRNDRLVTIDDERDPALPLVTYHGGPALTGKGGL